MWRGISSPAHHCIIHLCNMKKLLFYFIQGLVVLVPLIITLYIVIRIIFLFVDILTKIGITGNLWIDAFIGVIAMVIFVVGTGIMASNYFFSKLMHFLEGRFEKLPLIRHIYSPIKDFTEAFVGNKKKFKYPVLVNLSKDGHYKEIGFITQQDLSIIQMGEYIAVYLPFSYSFAGKVILVKKEYVESFPTDPTDAMKFVVSGGIYELGHSTSQEHS